MVDIALFIIPFRFHYLSSMNSNTLDLLASYFQQKAPIRRAWIFGSHALAPNLPPAISIFRFKYTKTPRSPFLT